MGKRKGNRRQWKSSGRGAANNEQKGTRDSPKEGEQGPIPLENNDQEMLTNYLRELARRVREETDGKLARLLIIGEVKFDDAKQAVVDAQASGSDEENAGSAALRTAKARLYTTQDQIFRIESEQAGLDSPEEFYDDADYAAARQRVFVIMVNKCAGAGDHDGASALWEKESDKPWFTEEAFGREEPEDWDS